jgi:hypothetical protein
MRIEHITDKKHFMKILEYQYIAEVIEWDDWLKECCDPKKKPETSSSSGDCCYDTWSEEYDEVVFLYNQAERRVARVTDELAYITIQRDMWKTWYDELTKVNDSSRKICHQLEIILHHVHRIGKNTHLTVKALNTLYCMIRDFYMQLDHLKVKFTEFLNCLKCINNPELNAGAGIRPLIDDYGKKLDIVIGTRDAVLTALVALIDAANRLNKNIDNHYGLRTILKEWKAIFNCEESCGGDDAKVGYLDKYGAFHKTEKKEEEEFENVNLTPALRFPICNSYYYQEVGEMYQFDQAEVDKKTAELLEETKERDKYKAWKEGLDAVLKSVKSAKN